MTSQGGVGGSGSDGDGSGVGTTGGDGATGGAAVSRIGGANSFDVMFGVSR